MESTSTISGSERASVDLKLDTSMAVAQRHLPELLMPRESLEHTLQVARLFPISAVDFFGFECRLGAETEPTDCALNLSSEGAAMLAGQHTQSLSPELQGDAWQRVRDFFRHWGETRQPAFSDARATWLEFDMSTGQPMPNLLFGYWPEGPAARQRPVRWLIDTIVPLLLGPDVSPDLRKRTEACFDLRPPGTREFQIGLMVARGIQAVRVCVFDLPRDQVFPYLERVGWRGPKAELEDILDDIWPYSDYVGLHLDIGREVYPHIGIEPNFEAGCWARQPHLEPRWGGLLDAMARRDLLTEKKRQALHHWIGHQRLDTDGQPWVQLRGLSHIKVVLRPGAPTIAKAYYGIAHRPVDVPASPVATTASP